MLIQTAKVAFLPCTAKNSASSGRIIDDSGMQSGHADEGITTVDTRITAAWGCTTHDEAFVVDLLVPHGIRFSEDAVLASGRTSEGERSIVKWTTGVAIEATLFAVVPSILLAYNFFGGSSPRNKTHHNLASQGRRTGIPYSGI
jgi:hypothetical protein